MNEGHLKKKLLALRSQNVKCIIKGQLRFNIKRIKDTYKTKVSKPFCCMLYVGISKNNLFQYYQSIFRASGIGSRTDEIHLNKNLKLYSVKITTQRLS